MKIVFRVDASTEIGTGHVMRCLTLADMLKKEGAQCLFICRTHSGNLIERIRQKDFSVETLPLQNVQKSDLQHSLWLGASQEADAEACAWLLANDPADWLIVDHYALDERWEKTMRSCCKRLMVVDDLADRRHDCDLLLDQNLVADKDQRYQDKVPQQCGLLLGPKYALLQPQYAKLHDRTPPREGMVQRILIYFGGSDCHNLTGMSIEAFLALECKNVSLDIVMSINSPHAEEIKRQVAGHEYITLHENLPSLAPLMLKADLAIGAVGATSWERCCMGLPAIVITLAENQTPAAAELNRLGMVYWLGHSDKINKEILLTALKERIDQEATASVSETCQSLVDGRGTERVSAFLVLNEKTPFVARLAKLEDESLLHKWVNDLRVRENSFHFNIIDACTHRRWFRARLRDPENCRIYIVETEQGLPIGQTRFERKGHEWEMDYSLDMRLRARGIGRAMLKTALLALRMDTGESIVLGRVKENNIRSVKILESLGFRMENSGGGGGLSIAVCSDALSWMNEYIPLLLIQWWAEGHRIEWTHSDKTLSGGDLCFYLSYGKIVTQATRKRYKHNLVIHESNLPAGRGWSPATWQILEKKKQITVTLFEAADSVDSGPIYLQENINLKGMELLPEWRLLQVKITEKLCQDFVGNYPEVVQSARLQEGEASFYPRRTPEDSRLDISCSLKEQFNLFRVVDNVHYPAFFALEGTEYILNIQKRLK